MKLRLQSLQGSLEIKGQSLQGSLEIMGQSLQGSLEIMGQSLKGSLEIMGQSLQGSLEITLTVPLINLYNLGILRVKSLMESPLKLLLFISSMVS